MRKILQKLEYSFSFFNVIAAVIKICYQQILKVELWTDDLNVVSEI